MKWGVIFGVALCFNLSLALPTFAQTSNTETRVDARNIEPRNIEPRKSGLIFLSPTLQAQQTDPAQNPASLWVERGQSLMQAQCLSCHSGATTLNNAAATFPKLDTNNKLINLEDQIQRCLIRVDPKQAHSLESERVLSLSAALHQAAKGAPIQATKPQQATQASVWQDLYDQGERLYTTRMGRINLACAHCHDDKVGAQMRGDVISQAHPTGFPIYRLSWQGMGSIDRRLRACYSGVQAPLPAIGSQELRVLELFLKVRAQGMVLDGPSIRR